MLTALEFDGRLFIVHRSIICLIIEPFFACEIYVPYGLTLTLGLHAEENKSCGNKLRSRLQLLTSKSLRM